MAPLFKASLAALLLVAAMGPLSHASAQMPPAPAGGSTDNKPAAIPTPAAANAPAGVAANHTPTRPVDSIVAVVNNEVITYQELDSRMKLVEARMRAQNASLPPRAQFQRQLLDRLIVDRAQLQLAKESGLRIDDTMLDRAVARIAEQNKLSMAQFRAQLEADGTPFAKFREEIRDEIVMQRLREREVDNKIQVAESEVDNYLAANGDSLKTKQPELNLAQILIRIPENATADQIEQRRLRAEEALQQLKTGGDFTKIAAAFSDANDALTGGNLGWRRQERLPQLFIDAVVNSKPGDLAIVKSANGFHILKLLGRRDAADTPAGPGVQQTHARHILIKVNQIVSSYDAKRRIVELKERIDNKAASFEEVAKLYSNDLSASKGGDLGWIYPGDTVPEFERAMDGLQIGQVSDPVETPFGFHLIKVLERKTDDVSKERQRLAARQVIRERKQAEAVEDWLRQVRDRAYVEYRTDELNQH
ncbi:MAG: peptidylprolyl isomerase [Janthinobacterium lividum]